MWGVCDESSEYESQVERQARPCERDINNICESQDSQDSLRPSATDDLPHQH